MKLLQINAVYGTGSTGKIVKDIHMLALKNNIESYIAYAQSNIENVVNGIQIGSFLDHKAHALFCRINGKQAYFSNWSTLRLLSQLDVIKPDIVHLHNLHSNYINLPKLLTYLAQNRIKTVITLHDCWFYTGGCFHYTNAGCLKWLDRCGRCPKKRQDTPAYFFDLSQKILSDRKMYFERVENLSVVGVSDWITEEAGKTFFSKAKRVTIKNGIDCDFFKQTESQFRKRYNIENKFVVLGMGNKWCNPLNADAIEFFKMQYDSDVVLVIAGCSEIKKANWDGNILYLPYTQNQKDLRDIYSMADVFVNCTREESLSLVNIEAQACGTPVITYANTGVKETVDGKSGFLVKTGDYKTLFCMVDHVRQNGKKIYSAACRKYVTENFDKDCNYLKYIKLYKKL